MVGGFFISIVMKNEMEQVKLEQKIRQLEVVVRTKNYHSGLISFVHPHVLCESLCFPEKVSSEEELKKELTRILLLLDENHPSISNTVDRFFGHLGEVRDRLMEDALFIAENDPAASSPEEVAMVYPGFFAIATYRIAHLLYVAGVPLIPRIFSELAHSKTGIDINPGAHIGRSFFIDHGTGIVIGETTIIGNNVKIYQGVTIGALSVHKADAEVKRHPTIEDNVTIYAGATILGGNTVVGRESIVGGNVWLTESVPPGTKIFNTMESKIVYCNKICK